MKIKSYWLRALNGLLSSLIALLGFSACDTREDDTPVMYGTPSAHYEIKGRVVNQEKQPVPGIQIIIKGVLGNQTQRPDTLSTNSTGNFIYRDGAFPGTNYWVIYRDVRNANITYQTDSLWVEMPRPQGGSGRWFEGNSSKEISIELTEKEQDEQ